MSKTSEMSTQALLDELAKRNEGLQQAAALDRKERKIKMDKRKTEKATREKAEKAATVKLNNAASQIRTILEKAGVTGQILFDLADKENFFRYPVRKGGSGGGKNGVGLTPETVKQVVAAIKYKKTSDLPKGLIGQYVASRTTPNGNGNISEKGFEAKAMEILGKKPAEDLFGTVEESRVIGNICYKWKISNRAAYEKACKVVR